MNELPNPLTPADCDLRDFPYMPLDVLRLRDSDLAARTSGEEFRCAVLLWCAAWHQVPSGSLPDDDVNLAQYAGFGRAIDQWLQHKEGAMRGWVKCLDGRLYHAVVAEKANEAWQQKHIKAHEKLGERIRKRNKLRAEKGLAALEIPDVENWISMGCPLERVLFPEEFMSSSSGKQKPSGGSPYSFPRNGDQIPPENSLKGTEQNGTEQRVNTLGSNDGSGTSRASDENALTAADISKSIIAWERDRHKAARGVTPSNQQVIDLAGLNVTAAELRKAYECAVTDRDATKDTTPVNAGFIRTVIEKNRRPQRVKKPTAPPVWKLDDVALERLGIEIGLGRARQGESRDSYVARIEARQLEITGQAA
jgi:hypothetical protein